MLATTAPATVVLWQVKNEFHSRYDSKIRHQWLPALSREHTSNDNLTFAVKPTSFNWLTYYSYSRLSTSGMLTPTKGVHIGERKAPHSACALRSSAIGFGQGRTINKMYRYISSRYPTVNLKNLKPDWFLCLILRNIYYNRWKYILVGIFYIGISKLCHLHFFLFLNSTFTFLLTNCSNMIFNSLCIICIYCN